MKIHLKSAILFLLVAIIPNAFAVKSGVCDYYEPKTVSLQKPDHFTDKDHLTVATLFSNIAANCTAKEATVAPMYKNAAINCKKHNNCMENYNDFRNNRGKFKDTINSTIPWCGFTGAGSSTTNPNNAEQSINNLEKAMNYCAANDSYSYYDLFSNAINKACFAVINGYSQANPTPPDTCKYMTSRLYQANPKWY